MDLQLIPIGKVQSSRKEAIDDNWGRETSIIQLDENQFTPEVLKGLSDFSHIEVIYFFHQVDPEKIETKARHPRNRTDWPEVGIFAQRAKGRPNRLGLTCCRLLQVDGLQLVVKDLDAIDGTTVLDIKPYMAEFAPKGNISQPLWATELMKNYY